jgi:hypothetical protein
VVLYCGKNIYYMCLKTKCSEKVGVEKVKVTNCHKLLRTTRRTSHVTGHNNIYFFQTFACLLQLNIKFVTLLVGPLFTTSQRMNLLVPSGHSL